MTEQAAPSGGETRRRSRRWPWQKKPEPPEAGVEREARALAQAAAYRERRKQDRADREAAIANPRLALQGLMLGERTGSVRTIAVLAALDLGDALWKIEQRLHTAEQERAALRQRRLDRTRWLRKARRAPRYARAALVRPLSRGRLRAALLKLLKLTASPREYWTGRP